MGKYRVLGAFLDRVFRNNLNANFDDIDTDIKAVDERVTVLEASGGSGSLVYNTVAELQAAYPTGSLQPAWVKADNSWYYWVDGTAPTDTTAPVLTMTPAATFATSQQVTMSVNETATIYYTTDGSTPTTASSVYSTPLTLNATTTVKAFAKDTAGNSSAVQIVTYTKQAADTTAPTVTPSIVGGNYTAAQTVALTANETATIYYTTDGSTPTTSSTVYSIPINISATTTLKYFAKDTAGNSSAVQTQTYTITIDPNIFTDTFDRANSISTAGSDWTVGTVGGTAATWGINTNQLYCASIAAGADSVLVTDKGLADKGYVQVDMPVVVTGKSRVVWRYQDTNNHFLLQSNGTGIDVLKRKAGAWTDVASITTNATVALANGSTVKIQLNGNVHQIYIGATLVATVTDSDFQTATKHGVGNADSGITTRFDNFKIVSTA